MGRWREDSLVVLRQTIRLALPKGPFYQVRGLAGGNLQVNEQSRKRDEGVPAPVPHVARAEVR